VLPDQTRDDDPRAGGEYGDSGRDEEIRREVPPHHDEVLTAALLAIK
jgi:hypothetical protein